MSSRPIDHPIMHPEALWDLAAIIAWSRFGETKAREMVKDPDFPKPVRLFGDNGDPRWVAGEVWEYRKRKGPTAAS